MSAAGLYRALGLDGYRVLVEAPRGCRSGFRLCGIHADSQYSPHRLL